MKNKFSHLCIFIVCVFSLAIIFTLKNWEKRDRVIEWDIHGYYGYLPAKFIYDDIKLEKSNYQFAADYNLFWPIPVGDGKNAIHKTMGLSILYSPFFFAGNTVAKWTEFPQNGFSEPYKLFLLLSAVFYLFLGLELVRKTLIYLEFSEITSGITVLLLGLATNLLAYSSQSAPMMHVYNFFLIALFVYGTIRWHDTPNLKYSVITGAAAGLIAMIYVPNLIVIIFFLLIFYFKSRQLGGLASFMNAHISKILIILIAVVLVWIPQLWYWKVVTGKFFYSLPHDGKYFFTHPKFIDGLISWRKGWLIYTPLMTFAIAGILFLKDKVNYLKIPVLAFLVVNLFVVFSWWNWWYGGSFGQRALIDSYAIMAIPLAGCINFISRKNFVIKIGFASLSLFLIWLNIFQTFQYEKNSLHYEAMTRKLYFKQFGHLEQIEEFNNYLSYPNYDEAKQGKR